MSATHDKIRTPFATKLILPRSPVVGVDVHTIPSHGRSENEKRISTDFSFAKKPLTLAIILKPPKQAIDPVGGDQFFSNDILRVEISGPAQPNLVHRGSHSIPYD